MPPRKSGQKPNVTRPAVQQPQEPVLEVVDPRWLLKALGLTAAAAVVCTWLALCLLYYLGSWQLVLRPSPTLDRTPAAINLPFEVVSFDASETGQPRLTGWWIPAASHEQSGQPQAIPKHGRDTILYLHDGSGSLSASLPTLALLHSAGIDLFAFDYRGFGRSQSSSHPTSGSMAEDASAALNYLRSTRHLEPNRIVPYGSGLGGSLAITLARSHGEIPAVIVDNPDPDPTETAVAAHSSRIVPIRLLYHEHFEIAGPLRSLPTPKLLLIGGPNARASVEQTHRIDTLFRAASSPAIRVTLPASGFGIPYAQAVTRFLDQYLPAVPPAG